MIVWPKTAKKWPKSGAKMAIGRPKEAKNGQKRPRVERESADS
jgi:hypothetical protein